MTVYVDRDLLDRQIVDLLGRMVGKVDDVEFGVDDDGVPYVESLLTGQLALGRRMGGTVGRWLVDVASRLSPREPAMPMRIPYLLVSRVDSAVHLSVDRDQLTEAALEGWARRHLINRLPGAGHAGE